MSINKKDVIKLLEKIAIYMELKGENPFKISAYRRAAQSLEKDERSLAEIDELTKIKGIGQGTNSVIVDYIANGHSETLLELEKEVPSGLIPLLNVPGLGGKKLSKLYQELGITDAESLKEAIIEEKVEKLPGFGKKSAKNILNALREAGERPERLPIAIMLPVAEEIESFLSTIPEVERHSLAGSLRRMRETIKDIDFIIATSQPEKVRDHLLSIDQIKEVVASGITKVSIIIEDVYDINIDFRLVKEEEFATTLHHFTGSKDHNVKMRQLAKSRGEKINEYGIEVEESGELLTFTTEEEFFQHFNLNFIPPEIREDTGEVEAFNNQNSLLEHQDIRGDLHMHSTWSDGGQSIEEMVLKAREIGYEYIAITDHSKFLRVANGLDEKRLLKQREEIDILNEKYPDIHIFAGVEMDILPDARLDFNDNFLKKMDFVIGAIHSSFNQSEEQIMERLYAALDNPYISIIAHPTGRLIGRREGYKVNVDKLIERAKETNTALEINANPNRLDLSAQWVRQAQALGVVLAINTDAHSYKMLNHMKYGVGVARKGWIQKETVINTWTKEKLMSFFNRNK
ncbi:DNA polymerase/3'-5' exonuclease PolX [Virgibacillus sp. MSJ-26]|uniref:DNA polymerase/3'-5' exonuclease PolX n=1 Tax=Virgibacillus sp. MSJ-26 TaxID=2841522 RepID=UPI001C11A868|nr:DNA polymerase/3'-5' exonuclease PolX [Virgibacillus sp. MSJ-26]